jgi:hypothetical protein
MDARDFKEIAILYCLFARVDGLKVLSTAFKAHVIVRIKLYLWIGEVSNQSLSDNSPEYHQGPCT